MDTATIITWLVLSGVSILFGFFHHNAGYEQGIKERNNYYQFLDLWRHCVNYFLALAVAFYFIAIRWPHISQNQGLTLGDFVLGCVFLVGILGWLPYFAKNITEGIHAVLRGILNR